MTQETINGALQTLDAQFAHCKGLTGSARKEQEAFYYGMRDMFNIALTEWYTDSSAYLEVKDGMHFVCNTAQ